MQDVKLGALGRNAVPGAEEGAEIGVTDEEIDLATQELATRRSTPAGTVRIAIYRLAYDQLIAPLLHDLCSTYPQIELDIRLEDSRVNLVADGFDIGFRIGEHIDPDTVAFPVGPPLRQIAVASPAYLEAFGIPEHPRDLVHHRCINWRENPDDPKYAWEFSRNGEGFAMSVPGPLTINDTSAGIRAALDGIGIATSVDYRVRPFLEDGSLISVLDDWLPPYAGIFAYYYRNKHMSPATRAVISLLRARLQAPDLSA